MGGWAPVRSTEAMAPLLWGMREGIERGRKKQRVGRDEGGCVDQLNTSICPIS